MNKPVYLTLCCALLFAGCSQWTETIELKGHTRGINTITFSPDGTKVVTTSWDDTLRIWDAESGKEMHLFKGHSIWYTAVAVSPDGKRLATTSKDRIVRIWDVESGTELHQLKYKDSSACPTFSPDGTKVIVVCGDETAFIWDTESGELLQTLDWTADWSSSRVVFLGASFSPDGTKVVKADGGRIVRIWDVETGEELQTLPHQNIDVPQTSAAIFLPCGTKIATGSTDNIVRIWDAETGKELQRMEGHTDAIWSIASLPDGERIATSSPDGTARIWNIQSGKELHQFQARRFFNNHSISVNAASFSSDGKRFVVGGKVWDVDSGKALQTLWKPFTYLQTAAISPDGKKVAMGYSNGTARIRTLE